MITNGVSRRDVLRATGGATALAGVGGLAGADDRVEVNVGWDGPRGRQAALEAATAVEREFNFDALTARVPHDAIEGLETNPNVRYVEENGEMHALGQTTPWGIDKVEADVAIDAGETGTGADVAIIDTGIDVRHEDLEANLGEGTAFVSCSPVCRSNCGNEIEFCYYGWDDDHDHGTHVAGIVGAADNNVGVLGVAPDVTLHAAKVLDCCGTGSASQVAAGIEWTADQGYDVGSMSLGGDHANVIQDACQYAYDNGVLLVASAGNDGPKKNSVGYPAAYDTVIAVSATDQQDKLAKFSSTGDEVELAAPGVDVLSTLPRENDYGEFSGTSMSCPHVSGAGAQLMGNGYTNTEARRKLRSSADDVGLKDNEQGYGRLNVADALDL